MQRLSLRIVFLLLILALLGCKKSKDTEPSHTEQTGEVAEESSDDADLPPRAQIDAELLHTFEGKLGPASDKRPEDRTPVQHHEFDLQEGDRIYVEMEAVDPFRTYLLIATPNRIGGYQNGECYPGQGLSSCIRFVAEQSGTYLFMANAATPRSKGTYTLKIYKESEAQSEANAAAHAVAKEKSQQRLNKHLAEQKARKEERRNNARNADKADKNSPEDAPQSDDAD